MYVHCRTVQIGRSMHNDQKAVFEVVWMLRVEKFQHSQMWESCSRVFQSSKYLLGFTVERYEACYSHNIHEFIGSWQGSPSALVVKWVDTKKERQSPGYPFPLGEGL